VTALSQKLQHLHKEYKKELGRQEHLKTEKRKLLFDLPETRHMR
jgi:hypothetical protein